MKIKAKITSAALTALIVMLSGCASGGSSEASTASGAVTRNDIFGAGTTATDVIETSAPETSADTETSGSTLKPFANGRESGKTITAQEGEYIENAFFSFKVNDSELKYNVNDYCPNDMTYTHLRVNVSVKNILKESIPIGVYDFDIVFSYEGEEYTYDAIDEEFTTGQFPIEKDLSMLGTETGDLYFIVPYGVNDFKLKYVEYYDDEFLGNTNLIEFTTPNEDEAQREAAIAEDLAANEESTEDEPEYTLNESYTFKVAEAVKTEYLSFTVTGTKRFSELAEVEGYDGYDYVEVSMKIKNTCDYAINIYNNDFVVTYEMDGEPYYATNITDVSTIADTIELEAGEMLNVVDYYWVPADSTEFTLNYIDYINDTQYNRYDVEFSAFTNI